MTEKHEEINEIFTKVQGIWEKFQKQIIAVVAVLMIGIGGWYGYNEYLIKPKEEKAADALFKAQQFFANDSSSLVLNGDGQNKGVLYILKNFGGTKSANL